MKTEGKLIFAIMKTAVALKRGGKNHSASDLLPKVKNAVVLFSLRVACIACSQAPKNDTFFVHLNLHLAATFTVVCLKRC